MLTVGELFAGVGGFSLGFEQAGWRTRWQVEWDKHCQSVLARHWPEVERFGDVRDVAGGRVLPSFERQVGVRDHGGVVTDGDGGDRVGDQQSARSVLHPVDCITFGSPCQDLSVAGKRAGLNGERSGLFHEAIRIIKEMRDATAGTFPRVAIWENVAGALSSNKGDDFLAVLDSFAEIGAVDVAWRLVDAQHFGVPQRRRRIFVVADFGGECAGAIHVEPAGMRWHPPTGGTAGEAVAGSFGVSIAAALGSDRATTDLDRQAAFVKVIRSGARDTDGNLPAEVWRNEPIAPTLNQFDNNSDTRATVTIPTATAVRRLTPRECERLMGWPDDHTRWRADGTEQADSQRYRQCGNGIVAPVAAWLAYNLKIALQTESETK